ncbi:hypothetical protein [Sphingomicrobium flavum]|uniref:hypothetical protein n=1 Tax=Sphingomicrobium flavum TaxID=1229164 RepID=UPI0021ADDF6E|nr:hypothetical protein [Sphingomicrobium flavum]
MHFGDFLALLITVLAPITLLFYFVRRWFDLKQRKLEIDATAVAEKAVQQATRNAQLEQRVRVLEQIVTDGGAQTAAQIEALRAIPVDKRQVNA